MYERSLCERDLFRSVEMSFDEIVYVTLLLMLSSAAICVQIADCVVRVGVNLSQTCLTEHVELIRMLILVCCLRAVQICILTLYKSSIKTKSLSMLRRAVSRSETYDNDEISILYQDSSYFQEVGS